MLKLHRLVAAPNMGICVSKRKSSNPDQSQWNREIEKELNNEKKVLKVKLLLLGECPLVVF